MSWFGDLFGTRESKTETSKSYDWQQLPDYKETDWARENMKTRLEGWGQEPGYGAIAPNWEDIWGMSRKRLKEYYWGDEMGGGAINKLKAAAARGGQTGQPAYLANLSRLGKSEAGQLADIATEQSVREAQFAEAGRQSWIGDMQHLMGLKPTYQLAGESGSEVSTESGGEGWDLLGSLGSAAVTALMPTSDAFLSGKGGFGSWVDNILGGGKATVGTGVTGGAYDQFARDYAGSGASAGQFLP